MAREEGVPNWLNAYPSKEYGFDLKVQSCKLYNIKYIIASIQVTKTEIFAFVAVLVFKLLTIKFCL